MKKITKSRIKGMYAILFLMMVNSFSAFSQTFTEVGSIPFTANNDGTNTFADIDGDSDLDLLILGDISGSFIAELFRNDGSGGYTLIAGTPFTGVEKGDAVFGDVDGDGDLDVIISGDPGPDQITELFLNDGTGAFTVSTSHSFTGVRGNSALALADVDGDNDLDLMLTGWSGARTTELHLNDGSGTFTLNTSSSFLLYDGGSIDFADVDGDGDNDVLLTGKESVSNAALSELYLNNGSGTFTLDATATATIENVRSSDAQFADIDGDGDLDVIVSGWNESNGVTKLYTNASGVFSLHAALEGFTTPRIDFTDLDNDSDMDLVLSGKQDTSGVAETEIYLNDSSGNFTITTDTVLGTRSGDIASADIDGDGDNDLVISGWDETSRNIKLYTNDLVILGVDKSLLSEVVFYPNPTRGILNINFKNNLSINNIKVFNILGREIEVKIINNTVDLFNLSSGIYLLKIDSEFGSIVKRIIKE
jgi:hypothetical protein